MNLKSLSIRTQLFLVTALFATLIALASYTGATGMNTSNDNLRDVYQNRTLPIIKLAKIDALMSDNNRLIQAQLVSSIIEVDENAVANIKLDAAESEKTANSIQQNASQINGILKDFEANGLSSEEKILLETFVASRTKYRNEGLLPAIEALKANKYDMVKQLLNTKVQPLYLIANGNINKVIQSHTQTAQLNYTSAQTNFKLLIKSLIMLTAIGLLLGLTLSYLFAHRLKKSLGCEPKEARHVANQIAAGKLNNTIDLNKNDQNSLFAALNNMQTSIRNNLETATSKAQEMLRIKYALDATSINVRIADKDGNIIYMNNALIKTLQQTQDEIRKKLPSFDANNLIGQSIAMFYDDAQAALNTLKNQRTERQSGIVIGGRDYWLITNPIIDENGIQQGTVGQWIDKTDELRAQSEIAELVKAAAAGDLSHRINLEGKKDFFLELAQNVNQMVASTDGVINETVGALERIANGDMTHTIDTEYQGAYGVIKDNANLTIARLTDIVTQIKLVANAINVSASEISAGNIDLSQRTEEQASSLEETASSMEEMASTVKQNAENAAQANLMANEASDVAIKGGQVVGEVIYTMHEINTSSKKIVDIISVIDGIAFQTNILALNAAVEAARAGEQGRGFAVVAAEVRSLAQRSAAAAKEIKQLIGDSVDKVSGGTKLVEDAGKTMDEIVTAVKMVTDIVNEIASASQEQSAGIDQVNNAITNMDEVTQQNAALVEQAAAAANSMEQQTQSLIDSVAVFKLNEIEAPNLLQVNQLHVNQPRAIASQQAFVSQRSIQKPSEKLGEKAGDKNSDKTNGKSTIKKSSSKTVNKDDDWEEF